MIQQTLYWEDDTISNLEFLLQNILHAFLGNWLCFTKVLGL